MKAFFETVFASSPNGILLVDAETQRALVFNDTACRQLGYTREEFAALRIPDYEASENPAEVAAHVREAVTAGGTEFDTVHRTKTGERRNVHVWAKMLDVDGRRCLYAIFQDVTTEFRTKEALRASHELLEETGRLAGVGGWALDLETEHVAWTQEVYRIHEVDPGIQPTLADAIGFYAPEARPVIAGAVQAAISDGTPFDLELPLVTATERRIWVRAVGTAVRSNGKTVAVRGAFQDITTRKVQSELQRLRVAALEAAADAVVITDRAGLVEWVNPAFCELTGYTEGEAIGRNPRDLIKSGKTPSDVYRRMWETILAGRTWQGEMINRRKDGGEYHEEMSVTPIPDESGAITHFVAIKKDITERLKLEAQFRQAQRMETVGQLASGIAHDFNNLLTVINGMAELLLERPDLDRSAQQEAEEVLGAGRRAATLTRQLLAFSRQQVLQPRIVNPNEIVSGLQGLLRRLLREDIDLILDLAPDVGRIEADPGQLEQVVTNLAVNARDAMAEGGQLVLQTRNAQLSAEDARAHGVSLPAGPYVRLSVADSGVGMDEATRLRAFEPFFTTKAPGRGTGLGLSTVYGIVKQSQGFIWVYSEVGHGTTFTIYLPQSTGIETSAERRRTPTGLRGSERILLVEDDPAVRTFGARILEAGGYTVVAAATGDEALELVERGGHAFDLLVSDVVMPHMSGRQLVERLVRTHPGMKVLYVSGYTDDTLLRRGVLDARTPFLNKPFTKVSLLQKVRAVLDSPPGPA